MIWIILVTGLALRLISLNQSLWLDEAINVLASRNYSLIGMITEYAKGDFHPPLYFVILWLWTKAFGISEVAVRLPSVFFGILTIFVVYLIGKELVSKKLGLLAAFLLAINPLHIYYSQEARMYSLSALVVSFNIFILIKFIKKEKLNYIFLILSNFLILMSDYVAYFIFPAEAILLLVLKQKELIKKWFIALVASVMLSIWWLPTFLSQLDVGAVASANLPTWKFVVGAFDPKSVVLTFVKFIIGRISLANKLIYGMMLFPISLFFLFLLWKGIKNISFFGKKLLSIWFLVPMILAALVSFIIPIYSYFRLIFTLPAFIILIALGISSFKSKMKYLFLAIVIFIEIAAAFIYLFNPLYQREDWRGLVAFLKNQTETSKILFESSGTLPPFDYYSGKSLDAEGALKNFPAVNAEDVINLQDTLSNTTNIYLIDYLVDITDPKRLVQKQLATLSYKQIKIINFNGVGFVYHYTRE